MTSFTHWLQYGLLAAITWTGLYSCTAPYNNPVTAKVEHKDTIATRALIDIVMQRLSVADKVALSKWDSGKPVENLAREKAVIETTQRDAMRYGLDAHQASRFMADQIEASKLIQCALLATWHRAKAAPTMPREDLANTIRPQLDRLQTELLQRLARIPVQADPDHCVRTIAHATEAHIKQNHLDMLHSIALDRALAHICAPTHP